VGHQKQGILGAGREVFGSGDVKANLQKNKAVFHKKHFSQEAANG
jgi:hypothetical protein